MPLMIRQGPVETRETGLEAQETGVAEGREHDATGRDECSCDACQGASRDEMWSRWA
jgi:hypothetical protein